MDSRQEHQTIQDGNGKTDKEIGEEEQLQRLLLPDPGSLPLSPPSAVESNYASYFVVDFLKPKHDQYIYRHANGLCVIGLAPTHIALTETGGVTAVDFNVGKSDRSEMKVTGKRKKNALHFEPNSALCKVSANNTFYVVRCCVKGSLLEVNDRLIKQPELLNSSVRCYEYALYGQKLAGTFTTIWTCDVSLKDLKALYHQASREGYIAIIMPRPADWIKIKNSLLSREEYMKLRGLAD